MNIVKRKRGHIENYDEQKLFTSIYASCLAANTPTGEAKITAERVCKDLKQWLKNKQEVTSADIRRKASDYFMIYNPDAAYMYKNQRLIT